MGTPQKDLESYRKLKLKILLKNQSILFVAAASKSQSTRWQGVRDGLARLEAKSRKITNKSSLGSIEKTKFSRYKPLISASVILIWIESKPTTKPVFKEKPTPGLDVVAVKIKNKIYPAKVFFDTVSGLSYGNLTFTVLRNFDLAFKLYVKTSLSVCRNNAI